MRTFDVDLRVCLRCGGKLTLRAVLPDPATAAAAIAALAHPRAPPRPPVSREDAGADLARHLLPYLVYLREHDEALQAGLYELRGAS